MVKAELGGNHRAKCMVKFMNYEMDNCQPSLSCLLWYC
jgi:hypothetical protein